MTDEEIKNKCTVFNGYRMRFQESRMNGAAILAAFSQMGLPKSNIFRTILLKNDIINKSGSRKYTIWTFPKEPVYHEKFIKAYREWLAYNSEKNKKANKKSKKAVENIVALNESNAITLLKSLGYKIQKRTVHYEEI